MKNKIIIYGLAIASALAGSSCTKEYLNPSAASEQQVINDARGLITLANGLQYRYSISRTSVEYNMPTAAGLTTKELKVLNAGNTDELNLEAGGAAVQGNNAVLRNMWEQANLVKANADIILNSVPKVSADAGTKSGLIAYASIFKALSLGTLATFWEQAPITVGSNATFSKREDVLKTAISTLETAATTLAANVPSSTFTVGIVAGIDLNNTIQALIARYATMLGDNDKALAAAGKVDLTKKSGFAHDEATRNALYESSFSNRNVTEPVNTSFSLPDALKPDAADKRTAFFFQTAVAGNNLGRAGFFTSNGTTVPVYRGGEMLLIKAEAYARKGQITEAIAELDKVLTKKAAADAWGIGADLAVYTGEKTATAVLTEIYKQRCIELYLTGFRLEDSRRFGRPQAERSRNFYPYPLSERDNNTSTPADPAN